MFTICCLISTPSFLPANIAPSSSIGGRNPSSLDRISPILIPMFLSRTQATTYTAAWGVDVAISWCKHWNRLFRTAKVYSTRTLVLQRASLNLCSAAVSGFKNGVMKNLLHGYPESPSKIPSCWPKILQIVPISKSLDKILRGYF